ILFWGAALAFLLGFLLNADRWWCAMVAGLLCVLGVVIALGEISWLPERFAALILFEGSALVFGFLYLIRDPKNNLAWARHPALVLAILGFIVLFAGAHGASFIVPLFLIGAGIYYIVKHLKD
ncbi:hypothetical protein ACFLU6_16590, partial [Acidobacteriota bacterium]